MKKIFTLVVVALFATSIFAGQTVYFKLTASTSWWSNDGAKIGALCKVSTAPDSYGVFADFFTLVSGTTDTYVGEIPSNEEPITAIQFLRYNSIITSPDQDDPNKWWNATSIMSLPADKNMFTATSNSDAWDSTTGTWGNYNPTPGPTPTGKTIYLDCTSYDENNWDQAGARMGVMFSDGLNTKYTDFMQKNAEGLFTAAIPEGNWTICVFMRYDLDATAPDWAHFWNRTCELTYTDANNLFSISDWDGCYDGRDADAHCNGTWSTISSASEAAANAAPQIQKVMINGQLFIVAGDKTYNLLGVEVK